ncbi:MAG: hypothetical protein L0Z51_02105 [Candidatus Latescibacteria bacterium]|nr:hypothetical protein [Candidatus Latescibacterota bacterium]
MWNARLRSESATFAWDGRGDTGRTVASGAYFVRASTASGTRTLKLTLVK